MNTWPFKDPEETLLYGFDWTPRGVNASDPIVTHNATVLVGNVVIVNSLIAPGGLQTVTKLTGGVDGSNCEIALTAITQSGQQYEDVVAIDIKVRTQTNVDVLTVGNLAFDATLDSAISIADADNYHANRGNDAWANFSNEVKKQLLRKAGDYIKSLYAGAWAYSTTLLLVSPPPVAQANAELALIASSTPLMPNITRGKKRVKVGPLEVEYDGNAATSTNFVAASLRIAPYLTSYSNGPFARLVRT